MMANFHGMKCFPEQAMLVFSHYGYALLLIDKFKAFYVLHLCTTNYREDLKFIVQYAKQLGMKKIEAYAENERTRKLYLRSGWTMGTGLGIEYLI